MLQTHYSVLEMLEVMLVRLLSLEQLVKPSIPTQST